MKNITPIQHTNAPTLATQLRVECTEDAINYVAFNWSLYAEDGSLVNNGTECFDGSDWDGSEDGMYACVIARQAERGKMIEIIS